MTLENFKESFDSMFKYDLKIFIEHVKQKTKRPDTHKFLEHIYELGKGGKRIRPYCMYLGYGIENDWRMIRSHLVGIEMLHLFALIHDDIIDQSPMRHNVSTLQHLPSELPYHVRLSIALLIGDLVFNWAYTLLTTPPHAIIAQEITQLIDEVVIGQIHDVLLPHDIHPSYHDIETKMLLKTARYSFTRPLLIGGILGNRSEEWCRIAQEYGDALGIAFQIQDDLLDIFADTKQVDKVLGGDIKEKQITLLTWFITENGSEQQKKLLKSLIEKETVDLDAVKKLFYESGAYEYTYQKHIEYFKQAHNTLSTMPLNNKEKEIFRDLIKKIEQRSPAYES